MSEFLEDPSVLTKDKLKSALQANNVPLPNGDQRKDVYVQLYLKNLTAQNKKNPSPDAFSSDEELPAPVVSNKSRSGRKATKKTDKPRPEDVDVMELTNEDLRDQLLKYGVKTGPILASTRKVYEKKLQKLLDQGPPEEVVLLAESTKADSNQNGNTDSDQYSDKEEDPAPEPQPEPEPEPEPEPVPVTARPLRSRGKTPVTTRNRSSQHNRVEKVSAGDHSSSVIEKDILKEMFPNEISTPTGITATRRPPIRGAAGRPISDAWLEESRVLLTGLRETSFTHSESRSVPHLATSRPTAPPSEPRRARRWCSVWVQLLLFSVLAGFLFLVYQAMETNELNPFNSLGIIISSSSDSAGETSK
ncbi:thymopoietin a [Chanos chanos]|uniref:Thymopoietin a n=1 Tax=Chanos chanos TaxID=29144 RepID=A0A6J2VWN1_CHACN|nr:thymopoietin [Chanos chanos]